MINPPETITATDRNGYLVHFHYPVADDAVMCDVTRITVIRYSLQDQGFTRRFEELLDMLCEHDACSILTEQAKLNDVGSGSEVHYYLHWLDEEAKKKILPELLEIAKQSFQRLRQEQAEIQREREYKRRAAEQEANANRQELTEALKTLEEDL